MGWDAKWFSQKSAAAFGPLFLKIQVSVWMGLQAFSARVTDI